MEKRENFDINRKIIYFHFTRLSHTKIQNFVFTGENVLQSTQRNKLQLH